MADRPMELTSSQSEYQNPAGCLPRLFWMAHGNIALVMAAFSIYEGAGRLHAGLASWLIVALLTGARYIDIVRFKGTTIQGEPATTAHLKRYVLVLVVASAAIWTIARTLGPGFR